MRNYNLLILLCFYLNRLTAAEFTAGAVLITFGAVLGKVSRLQLLVIGFFEAIFFAINEYLNIHYLKIADAGGSMVIHAFGAYFGLAVARVIYKKIHSGNDKEEAVYHSDMFAMIGEYTEWYLLPYLISFYIKNIISL